MSAEWFLRSWLRAPARLPDGERFYAIGDIHGQSALLDRLLARIHADTRRRGPADVRIVVLGDVIDRGSASAALVRAMMTLPSDRIIVLLGNHEAMMIDAFDGDLEAIRYWLRFGGDATLAGFGVPTAAIDAEDPARMRPLIQAAIPPDIIAWLRDRPLSWARGDYLFVHAGVRPGIPVERQVPHDLLWIRAPFLTSRRHHGAVVVHGHTVMEDGVHFARNRIGVDTGAYRTGRLSAVGLEGSEQWSVEVAESDPE
jgi:serine/threonine protein phosphatase 1